eukprot:1095198_1
MLNTSLHNTLTEEKHTLKKSVFLGMRMCLGVHAWTELCGGGLRTVCIILLRRMGMKYHLKMTVERQFDEDALLFEADEDEEKQPSAATRQNSMWHEGADEIETAMMTKFKAHSVANIPEYITFWGKLLTKSWWWLKE